jgi:hypothetical protein
MKFHKMMVRSMVATLAFALCGVPEALAQVQQSPATTTAPQTGASQDAAQQSVQPSTAPQQNWPTQDSAPSTTAPSTAPDANTPSTTAAPTTTAPSDAAQQNAPTTSSTTPDASQQRDRVVLAPGGQTQAPTAGQNRGTTVDPSAGPLAPAPNTQPAAPTSTPEDQTKLPANPQPQTETTQKPAVKQPPAPEPLGTAAAEGVNTAGNGASKPAGSAIAPAKQNRKRSLLIKLGALAAVGVAVGTVAALSRGTPGNPPNTTSAASTK